MNTQSRKRRLHSHEDSYAEPVLQSLVHTPTASVEQHILSWAETEQWYLENAPAVQVNINVPLLWILNIVDPKTQLLIQEQAAHALRLPSTFIADHSHHYQHVRKRARLDTHVPMAPAYPSSPSSQGSPEKVPSAILSADSVPLPGSGHGQRAFMSFTDGLSSGFRNPRLTDLFCCTTDDGQPAYQALPTTGPYTDEVAGHAVIDPIVAGPALPPSTGTTSFVNAPMSEQRNHFPCDDALLGHMYPPLRPEPVTGVQPSRSREGMVYPNYPPPSPLNQPESYGIQDGSQVLSPVVGPVATSAPYLNGSFNSTSFTYSGDYVALPPDYMALPEAQSEEDSDSMPNNDMVVSTYRIPPARRGPFKDDRLREKTARTRKMGSCIRCRLQRIRCELDEGDENGACIPCKKVANSPKVWRLDCLRWKIVDVQLFKPGQVPGHEWTMRWRDSVMGEIGAWASPETRTIRITEGYTAQSVELRVRQFVPQAGDKLDRSWVSGGVKKIVSIPPFAIVDMLAAKKSLDEYLAQVMARMCTKLCNSSKLLGKIYWTAMNRMSGDSVDEAQRGLLMTTLKLWVSVRLTTKSMEIVGDDTLDMTNDLINDPNVAMYGKIPLPPVMGAQLDSVLIHQQQVPLRRKLLDELQKMVSERKPKTWLTTYLVIFILLHNIALITKHDADYARKHGMKVRFARETKVKEYHQGANTLLAYWHYCNKGIIPFSEDCRDLELQTLAELDDSGLQFVRETRLFVKSHKKEWKELWESNDYENEYYFASQLFDDRWEARHWA